MASKQNEDLFNSDSKQNEGSLPLDFAGGGSKKEAEPKKEPESRPEVKSVVSEPPKKEMMQNQPAVPAMEPVKSPDANSAKPDMSAPRKPMHHVPPPYKKSVQEQQTPQSQEAKPPASPAAAPVAAVQPAAAPVQAAVTAPAPVVQEKKTEPVKPPVEAEKKEAKVETPVPVPVTAKEPEPVKETPVPAPKPVEAAVTAPKPAEAAVPVSEPVKEKPASRKHAHKQEPAPDAAPSIPSPAPVPVPATAAAAPAVAVAVSAPAPKAESPAPAEKKEPVKLQPKEKKEPKEEGKPVHKIEPKVEHKVEHKTEPKLEPKVEKPIVPHTPPHTPARKEHVPASHSPVPAAHSHAHAPSVPEGKPNKQEEKKDQSRYSKKFNVVEKFSSDNATSGQILQEGRVRTGLSIDQVSTTTKIKKNFIEALERDDFHNLPAPVYVNAYVRSLCSLYKIEEKQIISLLGKAKGKTLEYTVPEEVIQQIEKGKQVNVFQESKVRKFTLSILAACLILSAVIAITYQLMTIEKVQTTQAPPPKQEKETIISANTAKAPVQSPANLQDQMEKKLIAPYVFTMSQLPPPAER